MPSTCVWTQTEDGDAWDTTCSHSFLLDDGTPEDNSMKFCCFCGQPLEQELYTEGA